MDEGPLENTFVGNHLILAPWRLPLYGGIAARRLGVTPDLPRRCHLIT